MHITQFLVLRYSPSGLLLSFLSTEIPTVTSDTLTTLCPRMLCCTTLTFGKTRSLRQSSAASISSAQSISALSAPLSPSLHVLPNGCICLTPLAIRICSRNGVMLCASPLRFVLPVNLVQMRLLHVHRRVFFRWKHTHPLSLSLCAIDGYLRCGRSAQTEPPGQAIPAGQVPSGARLRVLRVQTSHAGVCTPSAQHARNARSCSVDCVCFLILPDSSPLLSSLSIFCFIQVRLLLASDQRRHNTHHYLQFFKTLRQCLRDGTLSEYKRTLFD